MQWNRRVMLQGLCCSAACSLGGVHVKAGPATVQEKVGGLSEIRGCFVDRNNANLLLGANMVTGSNAHLPAEVETMMRSTGNADLDRSFDRALQRLAETFDVWPKVGFYDDSASPNAMAMRYSIGGATEYAVVFGRAYFKKLMDYDPSGITLLHTAAHEFAHIWVYRDGLFDKIRRGDPTVKRIELHADFMAGYYLGLRKRDNPQASFWAAGVGRWQSGDKEFRNEHHHGMPYERLAAAETGFLHGFVKNQPATDAFTAATSYVAAL